MAKKPTVSVIFKKKTIRVREIVDSAVRLKVALINFSWYTDDIFSTRATLYIHRRRKGEGRGLPPPPII